MILRPCPAAGRRLDDGLEGDGGAAPARGGVACGWLAAWLATARVDRFRGGALVVLVDPMQHVRRVIPVTY